MPAEQWGTKKNCAEHRDKFFRVKISSSRIKWHRYSQNAEFCADLPVDGAYDSRAYIHASNEAVLKVTVEDESLQQGGEEHQEGQRVTPPVRSTLLFCE